MRKIYVLLTALVLTLVLFACSPDITPVSAFIVPNKLVYTESETTISGGITVPSIEAKDFEYYVLRKNNSVTKETINLGTNVTFEAEALGVVKVKVKGDGVADSVYRVYLYKAPLEFLTEGDLQSWINGGFDREDGVEPSDTTTSTFIRVLEDGVYYRVTGTLDDFEDDLTIFDYDYYSVGAITLNSELNDTQKTQAIQRLLLTPQANRISFDSFRITSAKFNTTSNDSVITTAIDDAWITYPENYDTNIFEMDATNIIQIHNGTFSTSISNKTYKPVDNELPINYQIKHNIMGYIWDFVLIIPISFVMAFFGGLFGINSFAIGIIFATIIVRTAAWPIYARTNDMSIKMALAQPEMAKLQAKYSMRKDPASQQKMQMETMALYKKHGISILGCFTPLMQMPIFLAMFQVVYRITRAGGMFTESVSNTTIFGLDFLNLSTGGWNEPFTYVLAAIVGVTMFLLQKISSKKPSYAKNTGTQVKTDQQAQTEKTMKMVSWIMVGMMVLTTMSSVNALGFYWVIGNLYSLGQTLINRKLNEKKYEKAKNAQSIV